VLTLSKGKEIWGLRFLIRVHFAYRLFSFLCHYKEHPFYVSLRGSKAAVAISVVGGARLLHFVRNDMCERFAMTPFTPSLRGAMPRSNPGVMTHSVVPGFSLVP